MLCLFSSPYFADFPVFIQFAETINLVKHEYAFRALLLCASLLTILTVSNVYRAYKVDQGFLPITALAYISFVIVPGNLMAMITLLLMLNFIFATRIYDSMLSSLIAFSCGIALSLTSPYLFLVSFAVLLAQLAVNKSLIPFLKQYWPFGLLFLWCLYVGFQYISFTSGSFISLHNEFDSSVFSYAVTNWLYLDQGLSMAEPALSVLFLFCIPLFFSFRFSFNKYRLAAVLATALVLELYVTFVGVPASFGPAPLAFTLLFVLPFLCKYNERLNWSYYFAYTVVFLVTFVSVFEKSIVVERSVDDVQKIVSVIDKSRHVIPVLSEPLLLNKGYEAQTYYNYASYALSKHDFSHIPSADDVLYLNYSCDSLGELGEVAYEGCWVLTTQSPNN